MDNGKYDYEELSVSNGVKEQDKMLFNHQQEPKLVPLDMVSSLDSPVDNTNDLVAIPDAPAGTIYPPQLQGKVILLNAPPGAGKDTIAASICSKTGAKHTEFKKCLYERTAMLFTVDLRWFIAVATDWKTKEEPMRELRVPLDKFWDMFIDVFNKNSGDFDRHHLVFGGVDGKYICISPREALIYTSELICKPHFGIDYFGKAAVKELTSEVGNVFSDCGFDEEIVPITDVVGAGNLFIVQFDREGHTSFGNDSRNYLKQPKGSHLLVTKNNGTVDELADKIIGWVGNLSN